MTPILKLPLLQATWSKYVTITGTRYHLYDLDLEKCSTHVIFTWRSNKIVVMRLWGGEEGFIKVQLNKKCRSVIIIFFAFLDNADAPRWHSSILTLVSRFACHIMRCKMGERSSLIKAPPSGAFWLSPPLLMLCLNQNIWESCKIRGQV